MRILLNVEYAIALVRFTGLAIKIIFINIRMQQIYNVFIIGDLNAQF